MLCCSVYHAQFMLAKQTPFPIELYQHNQLGKTLATDQKKENTVNLKSLNDKNDNANFSFPNFPQLLPAATVTMVYKNALDNGILFTFCLKVLRH